MEYAIKVEIVVPPTGDERYANLQTIYEQRVENLDVEAVIKAANKIT